MPLCLPQTPRRPKRRLRSIWRQQDGVAAVEFGLFAPILFFSLVATADLGLALSERMTMDHVLRSGAQPAMADLGSDHVLTVLSTAASKHFSVCSAGSKPPSSSFCPSVVVNCTCPAGGPINCSSPTACLATFKKFYTISATKIRDNLFLPYDFTFNPSFRVQVR